MQYTLRRHALPVFYDRCAAEGDCPFDVSDYIHPTDSPITALHYHDAEELGLCLEGEGELHIENRVYRYGAGDVQFVSRRTPHFSSVHAGKRSHWLWITLDLERLLTAGGVKEETAKDFLRRLMPLSAVFSAGEASALAATLRMLTAEWEREARVTPELAMTAGQTAVQLFRLGESREAPVKDIPKESRADAVRLAPALERIGQSLGNGEALREEALAALCHVSVSHIRRLFHRVTGVSPKTFIVRSRMAYAEYLLRKSDEGVLEIALRSGYENISCFNRTFVRFFGLSPGRYRREMREKN